MHVHLTIPALTVLQVLNQAEQAGFSKSTLCKHAGFALADLDGFDARIPAEAFHTILAEVAQQSGDEYFWLNVAPESLILTNNALFYFVFNAPTMLDMCHRARKFYRFASDAFYPETYLRDKQLCTRLRHLNPAPPLSSYWLDILMSRWHAHCIRFTGIEKPAVGIRLPRPFHNRQNAYEIYFEVPVTIDQPHAELIWVPGCESLPNQYRDIDPNLDRILEHYLASNSIFSVHSEGDLKQTLRAALQRELPRGAPTIHKLALQLHLSPRSLQRKLSELDTSFSEELENLRRDLAVDYLAQERLMIAEVAFMLGYKDPASFHKAFHKWYSTAPGEFRRRQRSQKSSSCQPE